MAEHVGFVGLGLMGEPMAANLVRAGFAVSVYNRTPGKASRLEALGAKVATTPAEVARPGGIVCTMVANDAALDEVVSGSGGFGSALGAGGVHLSMATISPECRYRTGGFWK